MPELPRHRLIIAAGAILLLAALFGWQWWRERRMHDCEAAGGAWIGKQSRCVPAPGRPILTRPLERA
ncbi:MAG: hypothetical protein R3D68_04635 [Hyphomicrobiaceae bacterium]